MRAFAAVFAREIHERRLVFPVALGAGLLSIVASALIGWSKPGAADVRLVGSAVTAAALVLTLGIASGASVIAGDTAEKRLSFFFARPISAFAIWGGKLGAALVLTVGAALLAVLPVFIAGGGFGRSSLAPAIGAGSVAAIYLAAAVLLVLGAHAGATVARLRSPWIGVDALLAGSGVTVVLLLGRTLIRNGVLPHDHALSSAPFFALLAVVTLALLAASAVQVTEGRTDARRAHGAFSATLWGILGAALVALAAFTWWVASAGARDIARLNGLRAAERGTWIEAAGTLQPGRGAGRFLFDAASGRSLRTHGSPAVFSLDGTRAVWGEPRLGFFGRKDNRLDLVVADLATGRRVATGLETAGWSALALSPDGRRLAVHDGKSLAVFDVSNAENPRQLAALSLPESGRAIAFVGEDTIRLFPRFFNAAQRTDLAPAALEISELSLPSKRSLVTGRLDRETLAYLRLSPDGRYFVGTRRQPEDPRAAQTLTLHDGRTGALVATLAADLRSPQARFLTGNRIAVAGIAGASARAVFFEGDKGWNAPGRPIELGPAKRVDLGGEIAPGRVAVSLQPFEENVSASPRAARLAVVDATTGAVSSVAGPLVPANRLGWWLEPVLPPAEAGSPASSLFLDAEGRLVRLDPATGSQTVLLGRSK